MILYPPVKIARNSFGWHHELKDLGDFKKCITQKFGENPDMYAWLGINGHNGIDIGLWDGDPIYASHDGYVFFAGQDSYADGPAGLGIILKGDGFKTTYWHLQSFNITPGQQVKAGDLIGLGDNTGWSTGSHLHFGLKLLDVNGNVLDRDNGFDGAIDPLPYIVWFDTMTEKDVKSLQALEGYHDPDGVQYWIGKPLSEYLKARLADKIKTIEEAQNE